MVIFVVQHLHELGDGEEDIKFIGIFSTRKKADEAIALLRSQPGFREVPDGFYVDDYLVDQCNWTEGYVTS